MASSSKLDWSELYTLVSAGILSSKTMTAHIVQDYSDLMTGTSRDMLAQYSINQLTELKIMIDRALQLFNSAVGKREVFDWKTSTEPKQKYSSRPVNIHQYLFDDSDNAYFVLEKVVSNQIFGDVYLVVDDYVLNLDIQKTTGMGFGNKFMGGPHKSLSTIDNVHGELLDFMEDYMVNDNGL